MKNLIKQAAKLPAVEQIRVANELLAISQKIRQLAFEAKGVKVAPELVRQWASFRWSPN